MRCDASSGSICSIVSGSKASSRKTRRANWRWKRSTRRAEPAAERAGACEPSSTQMSSSRHCSLVRARRRGFCRCGSWAPSSSFSRRVCSPTSSARPATRDCDVGSCPRTLPSSFPSSARRQSSPPICRRRLGAPPTWRRLSRSAGRGREGKARLGRSALAGARRQVSDRRPAAVRRVSRPAWRISSSLVTSAGARHAMHRFLAVPYTDLVPRPADSGSRRRTSGSMSAPFGQTIVPSSASTRTPRKSSRLSRSGSNTGPQSSLSRSTVRAVPSSKRRCSTNPSRGSTEVMRAVLVLVLIAGDRW